MEAGLEGHSISQAHTSKKISNNIYPQGSVSDNQEETAFSRGETDYLGGQKTLPVLLQRLKNQSVHKYPVFCLPVGCTAGQLVSSV